MLAGFTNIYQPRTKFLFFFLFNNSLHISQGFQSLVSCLGTVQIQIDVCYSEHYVKPTNRLVQISTLLLFQILTAYSFGYFLFSSEESDHSHMVENIWF